MRGNKKRLLMIVVIAVMAIAAAGFSWYFLTNTKDGGETPVANDESIDPIALVNDTQRKLTSQRLEEATTPSEKHAALLGATTLAIKDNDKDKALEYAKQAYEIEGLSAQERYSAAMNLVEVYGDRSEFDKGLDLIMVISSNSELMALEAADFYLARYKASYEQNRKPGPINCQEPQTPEDCPVP